jgi:hypothetical protein
VDPQQAAKSIAVGRIAVGASMIAMPGFVGRSWIGSDGGRDSVRVLPQIIGVRDIVLGLGTLMSLRRGSGARGWLEACTAVDVVDFAATWGAAGRIPDVSRWAILGMATGAGVGSAYAAASVDS